MRLRLAAALATPALSLLATAPAAAVDTGSDGRAVGAVGAGGGVVGGRELASRGVVVDDDAPAVPDVAAASWLVADLDTGEVLAAKDPHGRYAPASTLKTLTALTLIPELPADREVVPTFDDVAVDGSKVGLVERTSYPVHELFSALLMVSGNDAANVLASAAGGQERTAALMNDKAASLGALDTHAVNPHGLDADGQLSSAYDLALIARAGLADPDFTRYATTLSSSVTAPGGARIEIRNKNRLLTAYPGALAGKNGYTTAARASFVGAAERDGRRLVVTLMKAAPQVFDEATKLLDWGFAARAVAPVGTLVAVEPEPSPTSSVLARATGAASSVEAPAESTAAAAGSPAQESVHLPVTLAGLGLAVAALLTVRAPAPAPARSRGRSPRPPAQRRAEPARSSARR